MRGAFKVIAIAATIVAVVVMFTTVAVAIGYYGKVGNGCP